MRCGRWGAALGGGLYPGGWPVQGEVVTGGLLDTDGVAAGRYG
ncbi:hypothetical protein [Streptomyces sp. LN325]